MKKILYCILTMLIGLFCFAACGEETPQEEVKNEKPKQEVTLEFVENEVTLAVGNSVQLEVVSSKSNIFVFWSVRDKSVATVSDSGLVTAVAEGQTVCYASFGDTVAMCLVTVVGEEIEPLLSLSVAHEELNLYAGDSFDLRLVVKLGDTVVQDAEVEYTVDKETVAKVEDGKVVAVGEGTATITVEASYGDYSDSLTIDVNVLAALNA